MASISSRSTCSPFSSVVSPSVGDLDLLQHLANDHLDVLVVDLHALQSIDLLDLAHEIFGQRLDAERFQDVVRIRRTADEVVAPLHVIAFLHLDHARLGHQLLMRRRTVVRDDRDLTLRLIVLQELHPARDAGDDRLVLGRASLEQLGDARQTAGDVAGTRGFPRHSGEHFAGLDLLAVLDRDDGARREAVHAGFLRLAAGERQARMQRCPSSTCAMSSVTTRWAMPVDSSICSVIVRFSMRSWYFTVPARSVMTGLNDGSHSAMRSPLLTM